jgi:hypothetical protein
MAVLSPWYHYQQPQNNATIHQEHKMMAWQWHSLGTGTQNKTTASVFSFWMMSNVLA